METFFVALRAILYVTGFIFLFGWLALRVRAFDSSLGVTLPEASKLPGVVLMSASGLLVLACAGVFIARGRGTPAVFDPPREFVASGPYKFVRNPMYVGGLTLLAGFGLFQRSLAILFFAVAMFAFFHLFVLFVEEPGLQRRFGESYAAYKQSVNRWIPRFG